MPSPIRIHAVAVAALCALVGLACRAESLASSASSAGSSASSAGSASSGSVSDSLGNSSKSSTGTTTADGDYRVIEVAEVAQRPAMLQLRLRAADGDREFALTLPRQALAPRGIAGGDIVQLRHREWGLEFARPQGSGAPEPFFLVLYDDWQRELAPHPVAL